MVTIMAGNEYKTNSRMKIMEFLMENKERAISVSDIDCHMKEQHCSVNVTTIYRYLDKLEKDGNIIKYAAEKGDKSTYQYVEREHKCDEHLHLKCVQCGAVIHLDCCFMDEISRHIAEDHGFALQCRNSVIYGFCRECQKKQNKQKV